MYQIIGGDGREYGPVAAGQLRQWLLEGRVGGATLVRTAETGAWQPLSALPEFADLLRPAVADKGLALTADAAPLPASVRWLATGMFVVAIVSALITLVHLPGILRVLRGDDTAPGLFYWLGWGASLVSLPLRVALGVGLGRGRRWAWWTALIFAALMAVQGAWGLARTANWLLTDGSLAALLSAPLFLVTLLVNIGIWLFNLATLIILLRPSARAAFLGPKN